MTAILDFGADTVKWAPNLLTSACYLKIEL